MEVRDTGWQSGLPGWQSGLPGWQTRITNLDSAQFHHIGYVAHHYCLGMQP